MTLTCESSVMDDYLAETAEVDFSHPLIVELTSSLAAKSRDQLDFIKQAYEFVRDEIHHSWDIQSPRITCSGSETLLHREGICYAKANLLCAILRREGIPSGFCYQKLTLGDTPDTGYCIHAFNGVYLQQFNKWIRLDARGNKPGIQAEFILNGEQLAFSIRKEYDEIDYPTVYKDPNSKTIQTLRQNNDCMNMYLNGLPNELN